MSVGKRKPASSVGKRKLPGFGNDEEELTQDFKKILSKNKVDKVRTDNEKTTCLLYIISDYFKLKEIDGVKVYNESCETGIISFNIDDRKALVIHDSIFPIHNVL